MKKILIYGDSNTWGDNFILGKRIPDDKQWPNILQGKVRDSYKIISEGLPGRLAGNDEKEKVYKNGKDTFTAIFRTQAPVDVVIISLGTNDLQMKYNKNYEDIISDLVWYKNTVYEMFLDEDDRKKYFVNNSMPRFIYILPINFDYIKDASVIFDINCENNRRQVIEKFKEKVDNVDILYFNDLTLFNDGIHLDFNGHETLALKVKEALDMKSNKKDALKEFGERINLNVFGMENYNEKIPTIFIANHNCLMDIFYLPAALTNGSVSLISPRIMYKKNLERQRMAEELLYSMPIEAHGGKKYSQICLKYARKFLYNNIDITIFPEGAYIDPNPYVYKGHTGASRILFDVRKSGIFANIIPVAIEIISNNLDLDGFNINDDIINIYILSPINYYIYFKEYISTKDINEKNKFLHLVIDEGMINIAKVLNKTFCNEYIELYPKNNVIFENGCTVDKNIAQDKYYIDLYENEIRNRFYKILRNI